MAINPLQLQDYGKDVKRTRLTRDAFDADAYLQANPDVKEYSDVWGSDAWSHYEHAYDAGQWWRPWAPGANLVTPTAAPNAGHDTTKPPVGEVPAAQPVSGPDPVLKPAPSAAPSVPPPPPPVPVPTPVAPPAAGPDFQALAAMSPAQQGTGWSPQNTELIGLLDTFAKQGLQNPSRWDQPLVQESIGVINDEVDFASDRQTQELLEYLSSRGLAGSDNSIKWDEGFSLADRMNRGRLASANDLKRQIAGDHAADRSAAFGNAMGTAAFGDNRSQFAWTTDRMSGRDFEDDLRARTGFNLQGGSLAEDALMARALFGLTANDQYFNQGMRSAEFGEGQRRFDMGYDLDNRRFQEGVRQFDVMSDIEKDRFAQQMGLSRSQLEEQVRHSKQLETIALLEYLERTNSAYTVDENGNIVPLGEEAEDEDPDNNSTPPVPVTQFKPGEYGSPENPEEGQIWQDPSGATWRYSTTLEMWLRAVN